MDDLQTVLQLLNLWINLMIPFHQNIENTLRPKPLALESRQIYHFYIAYLIQKLLGCKVGRLRERWILLRGVISTPSFHECRRIQTHNAKVSKGNYVPEPSHCR